MAKKTKKSDIKNILKLAAYEEKEVKYGNGDDEVVIKVKPIVDIDARIATFANIATAVWTKDGTYNPGVYSFARNCALLYCFTDLKVTDADQMFELITNTSVIPDIEEVIPERALIDFDKDFDLSMDFYKDYSLRSRSFHLYDKLSTIVDSVDDVIGKLSNVEDSDLIDSIVKMAVTDNETPES